MSDAIGRVFNTSDVLASLPHDLLAAVAREHMLWGHLIDRALMPELIIAVDISAMEAVAIEEWMGASPNYTKRMRSIMGVDGDSVADIMKILQLDVGFVHEYMDVGYRVIDHDHGEFWLNHCGALLDAEPMGERQVISMCHHIEDPTFDATAVATNARSRIRPIHRPPRLPADRTPVCHWTVEIDQANEPLLGVEITDRVAALALAQVPLPTVAANVEDSDGLNDYTGDFRPEFRLEDLSSPALRTMIGEFALQCHLIAAAGAISIADRHGPEISKSISAAEAVGVSWVGAQRLARVLAVGQDLESIAAVLVIHPLWPTGVVASARLVDDKNLRLTVTTPPGVADPAAPGWLGLLAGGDVSAVEAVGRSIDPRIRARFVACSNRGFEVDLAIDETSTEAEIPRVVDLLHYSSAADWQFSPR